MALKSDVNMDYRQSDFKDSTQDYVYLSNKGLAKETVEEISRLKGEPDWMRQFRLRSYDIFIVSQFLIGEEISLKLIFKISTIIPKHLKNKEKVGIMYQNQ